MANPTVTPASIPATRPPFRLPRSPVFVVRLAAPLRNTGTRHSLPKPLPQPSFFPQSPSRADQFWSKHDHLGSCPVGSPLPTLTTQHTVSNFFPPPDFCLRTGQVIMFTCTSFLCPTQTTPQCCRSQELRFSGLVASLPAPRRTPTSHLPSPRCSLPDNPRGVASGSLTDCMRPSVVSTPLPFSTKSQIYSKLFFRERPHFFQRGPMHRRDWSPTFDPLFLHLPDPPS